MTPEKGEADGKKSENFIHPDEKRLCSNAEMEQRKFLHGKGFPAQGSGGISFPGGI